jgi:hypothetical protein
MEPLAKNPLKSSGTLNSYTGITFAVERFIFSPSDTSPATQRKVMSYESSYAGAGVEP